MARGCLELLLPAALLFLVCYLARWCMIHQRRLLNVQYQHSVLERERERNLAHVLHTTNRHRRFCCVAYFIFSFPTLRREQVLISLSLQQCPQSAMALAHVDNVCVLLCYGCVINIIHKFIPVQSGLRPPPDVVSTQMQFQIKHTQCEHVQSGFNPD